MNVTDRMVDAFYGAMQDNSGDWMTAGVPERVIAAVLAAAPTVDVVWCEHLDGGSAIHSNPHGCICHGDCPGPHWMLGRIAEVTDV